MTSLVTRSQAKRLLELEPIEPEKKVRFEKNISFSEQIDSPVEEKTGSGRRRGLAKKIDDYVSSLSAQKRRHMFIEESDKPFLVSRTTIKEYTECPNCFYFHKKLGIKLDGFPLPLYNCVDSLLKKEFDTYREKQIPHPYTEKLNLIPYKSEKMDEWRENFKGVTYHDPDLNMTISGAVDDIWVDKDGVLYVVDYKATSTKNEIKLYESYKQQMEVYQWLLRKNGYVVSNTGYFVYCNGDSTREKFNNKIKFDVEIMEYTGDDFWVSGTIKELYECVKSNKFPEPADDCKVCNLEKLRRKFH